MLFLSHAKPRDEAQAELWKRLVEGKLATPDTWEVALSGGANKREAWERLLGERKLGALAVLRNLRNMHEAGVDEELVMARIAHHEDRSRAAVPLSSLPRVTRRSGRQSSESAMLRPSRDAGSGKLKGKTVLLVDVSGSMVAPLSARSEMLRTDAAYGLAILLREIC